MKTLKLHGVLAKKFGKEFVFAADSARETVRALCFQNRAFKQFLLDSEQKGIVYAVFLGKKQNAKTNIGAADLDNHTDENTVHIVPRVVGSGGKVAGWLQTIGGAILTGIGFVTGNPMLIGVGASLLAGGVASLLMPTPRLGANDPEGNRPSSGFGGAVTTVAQGNPVPVLYGERLIGGFVASAGIYTENQ